MKSWLKAKKNLNSFTNLYTGVYMAVSRYLSAISTAIEDLR